MLWSYSLVQGLQPSFNTFGTSIQNKTTEIETDIASNSNHNTVTKLMYEIIWKSDVIVQMQRKYKMQLLKQDKFNWS
jgi:hypothetical protein